MMNIYQFHAHVKTLPRAEQDKILNQARVIIKREPVTACQWCDQIPLVKWQGKRQYCNPACKQKAYRQRKEKRSCQKN